ncbi:MAG: hypothetical protein RQ753_09035 [Desulfurivibrionaceae bacterium]|nr:hypothetical protein [Desulfobulbales bacterium]MDT8335830.1 hypothetical protein [Desulfurivibrionaceae bacterium]
MAYDLEKYRAKREKVLGVRRRGLSFGAAAALVAVVIILGLGLVAVPRIISYFSTRNLDDAIYKQAQSQTWEQEVVAGIEGLDGVRKAVADNHGRRLVVTFDRNETGPEKFKVVFGRAGIRAELLNRVGHRERMTILEKEAEFETP